MSAFAPACGGELGGVDGGADAGGADAGDAGSPPAPDAAAPPDADYPPSPANLGWIGGACAGSGDCMVAEGFCLRDGFPNGMCSAECDGFCPDRGQATDTVSFCADGVPFGFEQGICVARCDTGVLPGSGCPAGYRCVPRQRFGDPYTVVDVCVPAVPAGDCAAAGDELLPIDYPDRGMLWIPAEAQCGGAFPLVVMLHGINPDSVETPSLGGGRRLEILVRSLIDAGLIEPVLLAEPVHFQGSSSLLYGDEFDLTTHLDLVMAPLAQRGIALASLSYTGHSGAGCDADNGLYKVLAELDTLIPAYAPALALWGLEDICSEAEFNYTAPLDTLTGTGTALIGMWTSQGDPSAFEAALFPAPVDLPCSDALYSSCIASPTEPWCSYRTSAASSITHFTNPWFFVREAFPQVFSPDPERRPCR